MKHAVRNSRKKFGKTYADKGPRKEHSSYHGQCEHRHTVALGLQRHVGRQGACVLGGEMMHLEKQMVSPGA